MNLQSTSLPKLERALDHVRRTFQEIQLRAAWHGRRPLFCWKNLPHQNHASIHRAKSPEFPQKRVSGSEFATQRCRSPAVFHSALTLQYCIALSCLQDPWRSIVSAIGIAIANRVKKNWETQLRTSNYDAITILSENLRRLWLSKLPCWKNFQQISTLLENYSPIVRQH